MKKYELLEDDKIELIGNILYRIRALRSFSNVKEGDLGGFIGNEYNLSHSGDCWVYDNAEVSSNAQVSGDARVSGDAWVFGDARLSYYANVSTQSDFVLFTNVGTENGTLTVYKGKDGTLWATRGCFTGTVDKFLAKSKRVHDERVHREYKLLIEVAKSRILGEKL